MKRIISYIFMLSIIGMMISPSIAKAQKIITGKVVDAISRQPLEAALVKISSTNALTNQYGNFALKVSDNTATITVSFIGYKPLKVSTNNQQNITIALQPDVTKLEDVVVLQSGNQTKFASLAKIDLDLKPVRNTQELMRIVPGLFVAQHAGGGKAEQIFLRGFDCDHGTDVQVSVDGMPINMVSHAHGQGYADAHFIIPETINNIDFGTGPYYTQHGNLNTAGYVSFGTYNNISKSRVQIEAGRFNTFRVLGMFDLLKKNKDKQSAYIAAEANYTDGATINKQNFNRFNIFGKYNLAITNNTQLTASVSAFKSKWDASGQVPTRAVEDFTIDRFGSIDPTEGGNTERYNANIIVAHTFKNGLVLENQAYYSRYFFNLFSDFTFFLNDPINGDEINQKESRNLFGYSSKLSNKKSFGKLTITSTYGAGLRYDATNNSELAHVVKRQFLNDIKKGDIKEANASAYVQKQFAFGKWLIDAGVRFDYLHFDYFDKITTPQLPSQGKSIISPKLNIQYTFNSTVQAYIKTGKGFHSNDTRVVVANKGEEILPAAYGSDIGLILKPTKNLFINVAAWYLYLGQEFVYVGDDGNVQPRGKTRREGIDLIARYQFNSHLFANVNLNLTKPRAIDEAKGQDYIPLAPTATSTGGFFYKNRDGFNGSLSYRYIKKRPANEDNSIVAKGYFLLDGSINYTKPKYEIG
ncbi:MAG: carboxypeptidase-like regulatory domain-containing protein, partial [Deinococcales bacterium]|nr:carboxypeptidase-like regulatory domain-containing protein [Chitinophagaceae bacterium]